MKKFWLPIFAAAFSAVLIVLPVSAAPSAQSGTIAIDSSSPALGDIVTFTTTTSGIKGNQNPRIEITCYQDNVLTYAEAHNVTPTYPAPWDGSSFQLGGGSSQWLTDGGPANCNAILYYWDNHPTQHQVILATMSFSAGG